ncbi:MAG: NAD(P)/FAD-dependent oxidoreductase [Actinobacteria bacterium]|nr:NAD(P)/FAD-dependent oxidoreductase [Actinomycetota bacterium]MBW3649775.1 NAD(P)/FAD-dependent oxidoreductase [Actinomycetota bacterium]
MGTGAANPEIVVIGAGPAGLTAAFQLGKRGVACTVLEADSVVGGISRTAERDGWRFDIGGHRFFTKVAAVEAVWHEILSDDDFLTRPRMSRIYYKGKFFDYPLKAFNALAGLGIFEALLCVSSYLWARLRPPKDQSTFEGWVAARFGYRLYRIFFKTYTEKVWGVPTSEIKADWAAQRIKNLSLFSAVANAILPSRNRKDITSLIEEFQYPKYGPGMMWERCRELVEAVGTKVIMEAAVTNVHLEGDRAVAVTADTHGGATTYRCDHVISSMPITALVRAMDPPAPPEVLAAAAGLRYRDFLTVALVVPEEDGFPDNWIYVHSPEVRLGRIQNFGSWSPYLVKEGRTCLGLEYFAFESDDLWSLPDDELVALGKRELGELGLVDPSRVEAGYVVRMPKAYPMYDDGYRQNLAVLRSWLEEHAPNVHPVGRNGMHKYNNQDHSMYTAMLSVENIFGASHDTWTVNVEAQYHEEKS